MVDLSKNQKPRWGSDWDIDLGWILLWAMILMALVAVVGFLSFASVNNNRSNVDRDRYYADHCKTVIQIAGTNVFSCKND